MVAKITTAQAEKIKGTIYSDGMYFNPIQDANDNWVISEQEAEHFTGPSELIPFVEKTSALI